MSEKSVTDGASNPFVMSGTSPPEQGSLRNQANGDTSAEGQRLFENKIGGKPTVEPSAWLDTEQAAAFLGLSEKSLLNMASNGKVPFYKLGRRNRYLKSDLHELLLANRRGGFHGSKV